MIANRMRARASVGASFFPACWPAQSSPRRPLSCRQHYGAPAMLFALLLGMAMNFLGSEGRCTAGIGFSARSVLRIGVALLGLRITLSQVAAHGLAAAAALVVVSVTLTIGVSMVVARLFGFRGLFGLLTGGATAICGASAALALAAALPGHPLKERATLFTVIGVSALSTIAMIAYPMIVHALGLTPVQAGIFLGGTIHDVAQVVGAGYSISRETGDAATLVKLMRVSMLLPVIVFAVVVVASRGPRAKWPTARGRRCCPGSPWHSRCWCCSTAPAGCRCRCRNSATTHRAGACSRRWPQSE